MEIPVSNLPDHRFCDLPWYTEGPVLDAGGNIFFTTLQGGKILKIDPEGRLTEWAYGVKPNGQIILPDGSHLVCDSGNGSISRYDTHGKLTGYDICGECAGASVHVPNDLVADSRGGVYFTDSVRRSGKVYYYHPNGEQRIIAADLDFPNGIALTEDEKVLLVAESYQNRILRISLRGSGSDIPRPEIFAQLPKNRHQGGYNLPDGIKLGKDGILWVAHYGMRAVQALDAAGNLFKSIAVDFPLPSNLCLTNDGLLVTGGHAEPGPGGILHISPA